MSYRAILKSWFISLMSNRLRRGHLNTLINSIEKARMKSVRMILLVLGGFRRGIILTCLKWQRSSKCRVSKDSSCTWGSKRSWWGIGPRLLRNPKKFWRSWTEARMCTRGSTNTRGITSWTKTTPRRETKKTPSSKPELKNSCRGTTGITKRSSRTSLLPKRPRKRRSCRRCFSQRFVSNLRYWQVLKALWHHFKLFMKRLNL